MPLLSGRFTLGRMISQFRNGHRAIGLKCRPGADWLILIWGLSFPGSMLYLPPKEPELSARDRPRAANWRVRTVLVQVSGRTATAETTQSNRRGDQTLATRNDARFRAPGFRFRRRSPPLRASRLGPVSSRLCLRFEIGNLGSTAPIFALRVRRR